VRALAGYQQVMRVYRRAIDGVKDDSKDKRHNATRARRSHVIRHSAQNEVEMPKRQVQFHHESLLAHRLAVLAGLSGLKISCQAAAKVRAHPGRTLAAHPGSPASPGAHQAHGSSGRRRSPTEQDRQCRLALPPSSALPPPSK
jgi:hypothetical protein